MTDAKKPRGKPFQKGTSPNPGGRPKLPEDVKHVREIARDYTQEAVDALVKVLRTPSSTPGAVVSAANALLDRGWGKAEATTNVNVNKTPRELSTPEILAALAAAGVAGQEAGGGEPDQVH